MISTGKATLVEMQTILSVEDCYDLMDIAVIDAFNQRVTQKFYSEKKD